MLKFDIFSMRARLATLRAQSRFALGLVYRAKTKRVKKIAYKMVFSNYFLDNQKIPVHIYHA